MGLNMPKISESMGQGCNRKTIVWLLFYLFSSLEYLSLQTIGSPTSDNRQAIQVCDGCPVTIVVKSLWEISINAKAFRFWSGAGNHRIVFLGKGKIFIPNENYLIPAEPPEETKDKNFYLPRIPPEDCSCYAHACDQGKYSELAEKKETLQKNIELLEQQMTAITNDLLDSPCGITDEAMKTIYETDFAKRGWPFTTYRKLIAETDCELCPPPVYKQVIGLKNGYRDPTNFRLVPHVLPGIDPAKPVNFNKTPESINYYWRVWPGRSEYQDTYSRQGRAILIATQQYREPLPSSRRRFC